MAAGVRVDPTALRDFAAAVMTAAGLLPEDAAIVADSLVYADGRDLSSHGVARLTIYVRRLEAGLVNPRPRMRFVLEDGATSLLHADNGPGQVAAARAMARAIESARAFGIGACAVRESNHCGAMAYYTEMASARGMIGLALSNANVTMAPWGGRSAVLGTNPISAAAPTRGEVPFVLDMATSAVARGKIIMAAKSGASIPEGWALDSEGRPTRDAEAALRGVMLPAGGPKGYGLAALADVLCGVLAGSAVGREIGALYDDLTRPQRSGQFMVAIEIGRFAEPEGFLDGMDRMIGGLKASLPASGFSEVMVPGEPEARAQRRSASDGITLPEAVYKELADLAERLGVGASI